MLFLKTHYSWYCEIKVPKTWFVQKCFSSHSVVSEIIVKTVFAKRRHLFVPFLRFNQLRFFPLFLLTGQSTPLNFVGYSCAEAVEPSEDEQLINLAHLLSRNDRMLLSPWYLIKLFKLSRKYFSFSFEAEEGTLTNVLNAKKFSVRVIEKANVELCILPF